MSMDHESAVIQAKARQDFSRARMRAFWSNAWNILTGKSNDLLKFEEVQSRLRLRGQRNLGLQNVPIDKIVGTVGRYNDFTRSFLPRKSVNQDRWKRIDALARGLTGFPPIEVYKVGEAYFVIDGNHRVSVARQFGQPTIEAYVIEVPTSVPIDENTTPEELWIKEGYADFLQQTHLDVLRPDSQVILTEPGMYAQILEHIQVHQYFMGIEQGSEVEWEDAVKSWYDNVYLPMAEAIREYDLLAQFPDRTEADLYVWLIRHQAALHDGYDGEWVSAQEAAQDFQKRLK